MICLDTTFLIDLWRNKQRPEHPALRLLEQSRGDTVAVPVHAAGEFLEGAAWISQERLLEAIAFLQMFRILVADIETATHYARAVAELRGRGLLQGLSKPDLWIAASAMAHGAELVTLNTKHFTPIPALRLRTY